VIGVLSGTYGAVRFRSTSFLYIEAIMTIRQIANRIIKDVKAWPEEARQSQDDCGPKTSWDEYKEQIQYEEYDSFEIFEETIESMVRDDVSELSEKVAESLYRSRHSKNCIATEDEKREDIVDAVFSYLKSEAESQEIKYNKIDIEFVRYYIDDLTIVAEILSKVGPEEFIIRGYSEATSSEGEQGVVALSSLADEDGFEWISEEEFNREKNEFNNKRLLKQEDMVLETQSQINKNKAVATQEATSTNLNVGLDGDTRLLGITLSGILIESGTKKFEDFVKAMIADIGPGIKPYLKQLYSMVRFEPGFDTKGMSSHDEVDMADIEEIAMGIK
jgi:hypothetical protein